MKKACLIDKVINVIKLMSKQMDKIIAAVKIFLLTQLR